MLTRSRAGAFPIMLSLVVEEEDAGGGSGDLEKLRSGIVVVIVVVGVFVVVVVGVVIVIVVVVRPVPTVAAAASAPLSRVGCAVVTGFGLPNARVAPSRAAWLLLSTLAMEEEEGLALDGLDGCIGACRARW